MLYIRKSIVQSNYISLRVQNVTATDAGSAINVSWDEIIGYDITTYEVWKKINDGEWVLERSLDAEEIELGFFIVDIDVESGNTYYYRMRAKNTEGKYTDWSNEDSVTIEEEEVIFNPPSLSLELKPTGIQVTWVVDLNNTIPTTNHQSEVIKDSEAPTFGNLAAGSGTALYSTVVEGSTYKFRIRAYNEDHGYSEWSDEESIVFSPESPLERNFQVQFEVDAGILEGETALMDIYIPESLRTNPSLQNVGVLMFAHGNGETGNSISVLRGGAGPAKFISEGDEYPYIVISPQRPVGDGDLEFYEAAKNHLKTLVPQANIEKIAVAGWSGGKAPYWYLEQSPESISAAICFALAAGLNPPYCPFIANGRRVWLIGADDDTFAKGAHLNFFNAMKNCAEYDETKHKMTLYVSGGHDCVTRSFREIATGGAIVSGNNYSTLSGTDLHDFIMASFDEKAPSVPEGLVVVSKTNSNIVVSWEASEDDYAGVSHYVPNIDNVDQTPTTSLSFNFTGLENNTEYDIKVKAADNNGNESAYSEVLKVTTDEFGSPWSPAFDSQDLRISTVEGGITKSGTTLTAVEDLSERGNDINLSGSPAIVTGLNSIDAIHFRELNDERLTISNAAHLNYTDSQFIGIVAQVDFSLTPDQWAAILAKGDSTQYQVRRNGNQSNLFYQTGGTSPDNSTAFNPGSSWAIIVACLHNGRKIFRVNGSVISDAAFTGSMSANSFPVSIPGPADKNRFMELKLHELIIASGRDTNVIEKYEGWMAEQYGLRSVLPSEHPYKSASPLT